MVGVACLSKDDRACAQVTCERSRSVVTAGLGDAPAREKPSFVPWSEMEIPNLSHPEVRLQKQPVTRRRCQQRRNKEQF
jgi:hypothetical protein